MHTAKLTQQQVEHFRLKVVINNKPRGAAEVCVSIVSDS